MSSHFDLSFLSRRRFLIGTAATTLSASAVALLADRPLLAAMSGDTQDVSGDASTLNTALALEHQAINAYTLGAQSNLLEKPLLTLALKFQDDHKAHRDRLTQIVRALGATPVDEMPLTEYARVLDVEKLESQTDVLDFAAGLERGAAYAYLGIIPVLRDRQFGKLAGQLATDEATHYSFLAHALGRPLAPALSFGT